MWETRLVDIQWDNAVEIAMHIDWLLRRREDARKEERWEVADRIRADLTRIGIEIQDDPNGLVVESKKSSTLWR